MTKNLIPISILIAGVLIAGAAFLTNKATTGDNSGNLSVQEAETKAMDFINNNILRGRATASLIETLEDNGLYKIKFSIEGQEIESYMTKDGNLFFPEAIKIAEFEQPIVEQGVTIGNFSVSADPVCEENGKPIVYFFGSETCPYCQWEHPVMQEVMAKFGSVVSFHDNMDSEADMDIFTKYSTGGIPTLVLGCKYYRVGAGQQEGEEAEANYLTALTCKITNNNPGEVCDQVQDLINQIN